ncbi:hypothetical protein ES705_36368 [subsurface metagenome]
MRVDFIVPCGITIEIEELPTYSDSEKKIIRKDLRKVGFGCFLLKCSRIEKGCTYLSDLGFYETSLKTAIEGKNGR